MGGLGLIPNEIVGWRIKPDWYNFTVVVVKRHGATSKKAGQEYDEALAYCASLEGAVRWLIDHVTRVQAERLHAEALVADGSIASANGLLEAIASAKEAARCAVLDLELKLKAAGLDTPKQITHFLGTEPPPPEN